MCLSSLPQALIGASQSGLGCCFLDVSPTFSSTLYTIGNMVGAVAGVAGEFGLLMMKFE